VKDSFVLYHDPWEPRAKQRGWQWIDGNLFRFSNALLAKDTGRS
jgi:hypothetical protein